MEIQESREGEVVVLALRGTLDQKGAADLEERLEERLEEGRHHFVLDLAATEHVGSGGLRVLLMLHRKLASTRGAVAVSGLSPEVREAFELAGFTRVFTVRPTRAEAIGSLPVASRPARVAKLAREILVPGGGATVGREIRDLGVEARVDLARRILYGSSGAARDEESEGDGVEPSDDEDTLLERAFGWLKGRKG